MSSARFAHLLSPGRIGTMALRNRILLAPMGDDLCHPDGTVSEGQLAYCEARARGGAAVVMIGSVGVAWPAGTANRCQNGISSDVFLPGLARLAETVHAHGAKLALQLTHMGKLSLNDLAAGRPLWLPSPPKPGQRDPLFAMVTEEEAQAQSEPLRSPHVTFATQVMTRDDIARLVEWFAAAAERARRSGVDGIELHAAHGYLIDSFLSPASNARDDDYGGPVENRARLLLEIVRAIRSRVGDDLALWCRLNGAEYLTEGGTTLADAVRTAELAADAGVDAIHVSAYADPMRAISFTESHTAHAPGALIELARAVKQAVSVPVIAVGRIEPATADAGIAAGEFDFVAMGRKLLADPDLPRKLADGAEADVRPCMYHYRCIGEIFLRRGVRCAVNPTTAREAELGLVPAAVRKRILVAGGGPAGLETARLAALRGHDVVLCEATDRLGGKLVYASRTYAPNADVLRWLEAQVAKLPIEVRLESKVDRARVAEIAPDVVIVATGARWGRPPLPGIDAPHVRGVDDLAGWLLRDEPLVSRSSDATSMRVAVLGGGRAGLGLADLASRQGHRVTVIEETHVLAAQLGLPGRWRLVHDLEQRGVELRTSARAVAIEPDGVVYAQGDSTHRAPADVVLVASLLAPDPRLAADLAAADVEAVHAIGDCTGAGYIEGAMLDAARLAVGL